MSKEHKECQEVFKDGRMTLRIPWKRAGKYYLKVRYSLQREETLEAHLPMHKNKIQEKWQ